MSLWVNRLRSNAWAVSLQVKPFVRCIWLGGLMIALGGLIAGLDRRYRRKRPIAVNEGDDMIESVAQ